MERKRETKNPSETQEKEITRMSVMAAKLVFSYTSSYYGLCLWSIFFYRKRETFQQYIVD